MNTANTSQLHLGHWGKETIITKLVMYRDNSAYRQLIAPAIEGREDFELQIFPEGTDQEGIIAWMTANTDRIRGMEEVYADNTCCLAGEKVPGKPFQRKGSTSISFSSIEWYLEEPFGNLSGNGGAIATVVRSLLAKETPDHILLITDNLGDHDLFESGWTEDKEGKKERAIKKLHSCLTDTAGQPVWYLDVNSHGFDAGVTMGDEDIVWVFYDRHVLNRFKRTDERQWAHLPSTWRQFKVPIENLVADAAAFGAEVDAELYAKAVRAMIAKRW